MRIAVITPYCHEDVATLHRCHSSVLSQTVACDHFLIADGYPRPEVASWRTIHLTLPPHADYGNTPRFIGSVSAESLGYDAIALLDADNWFQPNHLETLLALQSQSGASVVTCARLLIDATDRSVLGVCRESDGDTFNDTNCYLLTRPAFALFRVWTMADPGRRVLADRLFWEAIKGSRLPRVHSSAPTVNYSASWAANYWQFHKEPPNSAKLLAASKSGSIQIISYGQKLKLVPQVSAAPR
jgi:hypothetical protein